MTLEKLLSRTVWLLVVHRTLGIDVCWVWTGATKGDGYGVVRYGGKFWLAHRLSWFFHYGSVPADLDLDHLCNNRRCIRPSHLEAVTHAENVRRAVQRRKERERAIA